MDLGLTQKAAADLLGVNPFTLLNWEKGRASPLTRHLPAAIRFLGFNPLPKGSTLPERLKARRLALGLSQEALGRQLRLHECTVQYLERGRRPGSRKLRSRLEEWLNSACEGGGPC